MGSLESVGILLKRDSFSHSFNTRTERHSFFHKPRSRFARFLIFKRLDYLQWLFTVALLFVFVLFSLMFLPGSISDESSTNEMRISNENLKMLREMGWLDFGENIKFQPLERIERFQRESRNLSSGSLPMRTRAFGYRKPQLALVFGDMSVDSHQILMVTVASALQNIGYEIQAYSLEDGPVHAVWRNMGVSVKIIQNILNMKVGVDWLNYDCILLNSLEARDVISRLAPEPFRSIPLIWTIHEKTLAARLSRYNSSGQFNLINDWKKFFKSPTIVVFPNYVLPMVYSTLDVGNFFVIPGSPTEAWEVENSMGLLKDNRRDVLGYGPDEFVVAIVGSQFMYRGLWLEHALVLQALLPLITDFHYNIVILSGNMGNNYSLALRAIALNLGYPRGLVKHISAHPDSDIILSLVDLVVYGSFLEEQMFPEIMHRAMCYGKLIFAPDLPMIRQYVDDRVNGYIFSKENINSLSQNIREAISNGKLSSLAQNIASMGKSTAKNLKAREAVEGYASLLQNVLEFSSEVDPPKDASKIDDKLKNKWQWHRFDEIAESNPNRTLKSYRFLHTVERKWNATLKTFSSDSGSKGDMFSYTIWEEEKRIQIGNARKRREEEVIKDRDDQPHWTWEDVYRSVKKADRSKNDLHERDDREMERTGQPLCIYEPYSGEGAWPFLHRTALYRGIDLSTKGRRPREDDVDASSRLPILNNPYYRGILGEYGAFFSIANRIDRIHKNAWIGFQSWRATARKASLLKVAEQALHSAIETRKYGDALYFWHPMNTDARNPMRLDFWSFCDSINAGNCRSVFMETLKKTYGIESDWNSLPSMPMDGDTWSVMNCWVMSTRSFIEFVMFSRMFVNALDAQFYEDNRQHGNCPLSIYKDKHCYSRLLELLVNVWAYHSARRMVYINPETGSMQEHHVLNGRRGQMWVKWFSHKILKSMDEDLAESFDSDPKKRWIWPSTGEVFWQGVYERERNMKQREKEVRKQKRKDKISKMLMKGGRQKIIGRYLKPPPDALVNENVSR